jgi:hypothetical protein
MMTPTKQSELHSLERAIAVQAARLEIESCCLHDPPSQDRWYNIERDLEGVEKEDVHRAVRYLELRGFLRRHPVKPNLVCLVASRKRRV